MTRDYQALSDEELLSLAHAGDEWAEETLCVRYKNIVRIKARPYFLIGADREDLIQEGMIGLYKAIRDYSGEHEASFGSFADMCIVRQILTAVKRSTRKKHSPLNSYISLYENDFDREGERPLIDTVSTGRSYDPEQLYISKESLEEVLAVIESELSPLEKQCLDLFRTGRSYQEIADATGRTTKAVDNALQRVKKKIELFRK